MYSSAYARQARRISTALISRFFEPSFLSTCCSIGRPWQSQPGTYGASKPIIGAAAHDDVLQDLVQGVPDVDVAVGVGRAVVQDEAGPPGAPSPGSWPRGRIASQAASCWGSRRARSAFMGKSVRGRLSVLL